MMERFPDEYEVISDEGEWCAASTSLDEAKHYAAIYSQDHGVQIVWVSRAVIDHLPKMDNAK